MIGMGQRIKDRRQELGLTQSELADRVGVSRIAVTRWETDHYKPFDNIIELSAALNVTADWILTGRGPIQHEGELVSPNWEAIHLLEQGLAALRAKPLITPVGYTKPLIPDEDVVSAKILQMPLCAIPPVELVGIAAADEGDGIAYDGEITPGEWVEVDADEIRAITVRGRSAEEFARDGQQAMIDSTRAHSEIGQPCIIFQRNGELRLKRKIKANGGTRAYESINPLYPVFQVAEGQVLAEWPVVAVMARTRLQSPVETLDEGPPPAPAKKARARKK